MTTKHVTGIADLSSTDLEQLVLKAAEYKSLHAESGRALTAAVGSRGTGRVMASLFYEPSTRTRLSFESAMLRLGGTYVGTENAAEFSSAIKGETLEDSIRVISGYVDVITLRHTDVGAATRAAAVSTVPVINAGDGTGEHPTQAFLDYFTIWEHHEHMQNGTVTIVGDLRNGRTVQSLVRLITKTRHTSLEIAHTVHCIAPPPLQLASALISSLEAADITVHTHSVLAPEVLRVSDVVYTTRTQTERGSDMGDDAQRFVLTEQHAKLMPECSMILHPLPRNSELPIALDTLSRAHYFDQAKNGMYVRMALLDMLLP